MSSRSYAIIGTGAIGGYYGACLQRAGIEVHFLLNRDYHHVKKSGLVVESIKGDFNLPNVKAYNKAALMPACDVVIIALKTTINDDLLAQILPHVIKENGIVITLQNGLGIEEKIRKIVLFKKVRIVSGLCFICSNKVESGHIRHLDYGSIALGEYLPEYKKAGIAKSISQIAEDFEMAGIEIQLQEDLLLSRWQKLVWNIPFNGLSVLLNATTEQLMANEDVRSLIKAIMQEVQLAASTCDRQIEPDFIDKMLQFTLTMKPYRTSMKIDYDRGNPLEIEAIFGNPLKMATRNRVNLTRIEMLYQQLKFLNDKNLSSSLKLS